MTNTDKLIQYIKEYEALIHKGNKYLQIFYQLNKSPLLERREGKIPVSGYLDEIEMSYKFHGIGCKFKFKNAIVDFDYSFVDFIYKGFETSKLYWYIESCADPDGEVMTKVDFDNSLNQLENKGVIIKSNMDSLDTHDYVLKETTSRGL